MRWVQWEVTNRQKSRVHATMNGRRSVCGRQLGGPFILDSETKPRGQQICTLCEKIEVQERSSHESYR
jgi:hypothetical protein